MIRWTVRAAAAAVFLLAGALMASTLSGPATPVFVEARAMERQVVDDHFIIASGDPVRLGDLTGPPPQAIQALRIDEPVLILKLDASALAAAKLQHGPLVSALAIDVRGEDAVLLAYHAKSTHLGCTVALFKAELPGGDRDGDGQHDGWIIDPCSQSLWDPFDMGSLRGQAPAKGPLDGYTLRLDGDIIQLGERIPS